MNVRSLGMAALPHVGSLLVMLLLSSVVFWPSVSQDKFLRQGDITQNLGMGKEARDYERLEGELPHWTNSMFGGMPTVHISGTDVGTAPKLVWKALRKAMPTEVGTLWMAMISAYVLGLCLGLGPWLSLMLGAGFGLASVNVLYLAAGHATKVRAIATMPGVLGGMLLAYRGSLWRGLGVTALFTALHLESGHVQITYYLLFLLAAVAVAEGIRSARQGRVKAFLQVSGWLLAAGLVGALPEVGHLAMTERYSKHTTRGEVLLPAESEASVAPEKGAAGLDREYILEFSMARGEFWSMAIPDVKGGNSQLYWGEQRFSGGAFYFGALAFALCLAWLVAGSHWLRWPLLAVSALAVVLSWRDASVVTDVFLEHVPLFNKFRDTKMMLVLVQLAVPLGAVLALREAASAGAQWKRWAVGSSVPFVLFLAFYALPEVWFDFTSHVRPDAVLDEVGKTRAVAMRIDLFKADVLRAAGLALLGGLGLMALVRQWGKRQWVVLGLLGVLVLDMFSVDGRYLSDRNFTGRIEKRYPFAPSATDQWILAREAVTIPGFEAEVAEARARREDQLGIKLGRRHANILNAAAFEVLNRFTHFRVFDLSNPFNDARTSYFYKSVGGYHGAKLRRTQDFIDRVLNPERDALIGQLQAGNFNVTAEAYPGLAMLNTKYLVLPGAEQPLPFVGAPGPAWWVQDVKWVDSNAEEMAGISGLDVATTAVVHADFKDVLGTVSDPGTAAASLTQYHPDGSRYRVASENGGLLVLSEITYPEGWTALVDGQPTELVRVNYLLRGLRVPAGEHEVQLSFEPEGWGLSTAMSHAGTVLWLLLLGWSGWRGRGEVVED